MNEEVKALIDSLRRGQYEDPAEKIGLLTAALQEHRADAQELLVLLRAPQIPLRLAALGACRARNNPEIISELLKLVEDPEARVREKLAGVLESFSPKAVLPALQALARDSEDLVRTAAVKSTSGRPECIELQQKLLETDGNWEVRIAAVNALASQKTHAVVALLFTALANDSDMDVSRRCAEAIEKRLANFPQAVAKLLPSEISVLSSAERKLKMMPGFSKLQEWVTEKTTIQVDPQFLASFGTDLTAQALEGTLPRGHGLVEPTQKVLQLLRRERWRSVALLGPAGVGKSALVNELVYALAKPENGAWRVLRMSPTDFMAGTRFLGEWETKVRDLVAAVKKPRRVLLYVPSLSDLSAMGRWEKSDSNVATALAPYLEEGSIILLGESTPEEFERGIGAVPSLHRLFDRVLVEEATPEETALVLQTVRDESQAQVPNEVLNQLLETASQFLSHLSLPGSAVSLLRAVLQSTKDLGRAVEFRDVLNSLSQSTGIPADLLDDAIPLDQAKLRSFFERRIIGQKEAVDAVVDLVTLIKAGLTDPQKPFGVMLFTGPTGVGKTELARALAEFIFGDADRLKRFDMSEYASPDGFLRLMGAPNQNGLLTEAIRQHPFSVILLDEIEKSHINVFDLCLQIFDAGRLTDGRGQTLDFRRTILILTSNIGATAPTSSFGFQQTAAAQLPEVDKDRTFRELTRFFRPEFLNRLDRIVQFRPLSLEVAEQIARREIDLVLQRSGIRRRELGLDIDPAVISLLVREGYSPHFGARPLKRTVERLILLPVARAISSGALRHRSVLRLTDVGGRIEVSTLKPPVSLPPDTSDKGPSLQSLDAELSRIREAFEQLEPCVRPMADRKSELLLQTREPGFYDDVLRRTAVFDEIQKLDQFLASKQGLGKALIALQERWQRQVPTSTEEPGFHERLAQLAAQVEQLRMLSESKDARDLSDVLICLSLVERAGTSIDALPKLSAMYHGLARRRRMSVEVLGEFVDGRRDRAWLLVSGLGAYRLLKFEHGLHQFHVRVREKVPRSGREVTREDRETIRVEVFALSTEPDKQFRNAVRAKIVPLKDVQGSLVPKPELNVSLFHEPGLRSLELWVVGPKTKALDNSLLILHSLLGARDDGDSLKADTVIRRYELGVARRIRDMRSGRTTTSVERVLKGQMDTFLIQEGI